VRQTLSTPEGFQNELEYILKQGQPLARTILDKSLSVDTVTIFSRTNSEYAFATAQAKLHGPISKVSHGSTLYIEPRELYIGGQRIKYLGVRKPDETRQERGYVDYPVANISAYTRLAANNHYMSTVMSGRGQEN